jgi:hypothetical protein
MNAAAIELAPATVSSSRLSVCYVAPGQRLLPTAGSTRNVLSVARAMSEWADVTIAFRGIAEPVVGEPFKVMSIEEVQPGAHGVTDDVAIRGLNPFVHLKYLRGLRRFAAQVAGEYDIIFEKGWRFSGYLSQSNRPLRRTRGAHRERLPSLERAAAESPDRRAIRRTGRHAVRRRVGFTPRTADHRGDR